MVRPFPSPLRTAPASLVLAALCCAVAFAAAPAAAADEAAASLHAQRALRRQSLRALHLAADKSTGPVRFGLLVIPVDFADAPLPPGWDQADLLRTLAGQDGQTLRNYFRVASAGAFDLAVTLAPPVHLAGGARDYSDIGLNLFTRTRALARQSLEATAALGLDFAALDMDGPDRAPASGDDDGQVDGVLILHAEIGQENDPQEGVIQALQFFLAEPVVSRGTAASFYAVASLHSGLGIWAHETAHLLGMEDRYDPRLQPAGESEVSARGGLGRFSLMAGGAWGVGGGLGPAMPDAYTSLQMGWIRADTLAVPSPQAVLQGWPQAAGTAGLLWTPGRIQGEYFLLETRDPAAAAPFDAGLWSGQLLVYHVDEAVPEGSTLPDDLAGTHLRVALVEADGDGALAAGEDQGVLDDLFPGRAEVGLLPAAGNPGTEGYGGPTGLALAGIQGADDGVQLQVQLQADKDLEFLVGPLQDGSVLALQARALGPAFANLRCDLQVLDGGRWGTFAGGALSTSCALVLAADGWYRPSPALAWEAAPDLQQGAVTEFDLAFHDDDWTGPQQSRLLQWTAAELTLDFAALWPGEWTVAGSEPPLTTWHRWQQPPWLTADASPVLACTGADYATPQAWPQVLYGNADLTTLTSGPLDPQVRAVRLIHAIEVERLDRDSFMDGGLVRWMGQDGALTPAEPLGGWAEHLSAQALNPLHDLGVFAQDTLSVRDGLPVYGCDVVPVPAGAGGPWRLQLAFGSNTLWRRKGWFVAQVGAVLTEPAQAAFAASWDPHQGLAWTWPFADAQPDTFVVQSRSGDEGAWGDLLAAAAAQTAVPGGFLLPGPAVRSALDAAAAARPRLRVLGEHRLGWIATAGVEAATAPTDAQPAALSAPWPNPARGRVRFMIEVPEGGTGRLRAYDLRGRLLYDRECPAGRQLAEWPGTDRSGAPVPAGAYIVRLEGIGPVVNRKVVLLR